MKNRFVTFAELQDYFENDILWDDISGYNVLGIGSVSDFLYLIEYQKKHGMRQINIHQRYEAFEADPKKHGKIYIAELDRDQLEAALFSERNNITSFWQPVTNARIEPRNSVTYLALRNTTYTWWDENVIEEMVSEYDLF